MGQTHRCLLWLSCSGTLLEAHTNMMLVLRASQIGDQPEKMALLGAQQKQPQVL